MSKGTRAAKPNAGHSGITSNSDLRDVAFMFRNLFRSGSLTASEILRQTGELMPKYQKPLKEGSIAISSKGASFSEAVSGLFDATTLTVVKAGEESGTLAKVFDQIWMAAKTQEEINKILKKLIMPIVLCGFGAVISLGFFIFLIPSIYESLANGAPPDYSPSALVLASVAANKFVLQNLEMVSFSIIGAIVAIIAVLKQRSVQQAINDAVVKLIVSFDFLGKSYANLKFGLLAQYIQIVSAAQLDADQRIDLVLNILPAPMRPGLQAFRRDMLTKGIANAAKADGKPEGDPRRSEVLWPPYMRLAFSQANEGDWETPMYEFGLVMLEDGKDAIQKRIATMQTMAILVVGILVVIPLGLLYTTMGEILTMRMQAL